MKRFYQQLTSESSEAICAHLTRSIQAGLFY